MDKKLYVIIPAAGSSTRMGKNKLFLKIGENGRTVIAQTLFAFSKLSKLGIDISAVLVTNEANMQMLEEEVSAQGFDGIVEKIVLGGATRTESVYNGVQALKDFDVPPAAGRC